MTRARLCLVVDDWPELDRELWHSAQTSTGFLESDKPASRWSQDRRGIVEQAYGQWLAFLQQNGALEPSCSPGNRITKALLHDFVAELQRRVSSTSTAMMIEALRNILAVLEPQQHQGLLVQVSSHLTRIAVPSRNKLARLVTATALFDLGMRLMDSCERGQNQAYKATRFRDGLLIALLISCPMRLKNLTGLVIGRHLVFDRHNYRLEITAAETKTGRPYVADVPHELTPYMDCWLQDHRPAVQSVARTNRREANSVERRLWLGRLGRPMSAGAIQHQIASRTQQVFGKSIRPHLFRDCAVTELVDVAPEEIGIAHHLLGHADLRTTQKHYIQALGTTAHRRIQDSLVARRRVLHHAPWLLRAADWALASPRLSRSRRATLEEFRALVKASTPARLCASRSQCDNIPPRGSPLTDASQSAGLVAPAERIEL